MICGSWDTGEYFNYKFIENNMVELWNKTTNSIIISYNEWLIKYYIRDKWGSV